MYLCVFLSDDNGMNLVIDIGNTHAKLAVFKNGAIHVQERIAAMALEGHVISLYERYPVENTIIANVSRLPEAVIGRVAAQYPVHVLTGNSKVPFKNNYRTPETLGVDRIALTAAASQRFPGKNILIIDAGTCITYDLLNAESEYSGGAISPGIYMRYRALHTFTGNLPLLEPGDFSGLTGNSTSESIHSGVINGICHEIEGVIARYEEKYPLLTVILTGGDAQFLSKRLKNSIFVDQNFLMEGLHVVLEHNIQ